MTAFVRWMRAVLPRDTIVAIAVGCDLLIEATYLWCLYWWGAADDAAFAWMRLLLQVFAAGSYGGYRVATFHPANDSDYRQWLETTPWTPRNPLPMGPLQIVPQDVVVLVASMLLCRIEDLRVLAIPASFLSAYSFAMAITVWYTGQKLWAYAIGVGLGAVIFAIQRPVGAFAAAIATGMLATLAQRRSLAAYPWDLPWQLQVKSLEVLMQEFKNRRLGWPFDIFAPRIPKVWVTWTDGLGLSLLAGWWFLAAYWQVEQAMRNPADLAPLIMLPMMGILTGSIVRCALYLANHRPPISFLGRLRTLRPWQRRFDLIFLAPLAAVAVMVLCLKATICAELKTPFFGLLLPQWSALAFAPLGISLSLGILLLGGPALERWRLIGRHRIVFDQGGKSTGLGQSSKNQEFVQIG
jgi:hypothetical protein